MGPKLVWTIADLEKHIKKSSELHFLKSCGLERVRLTTERDVLQIWEKHFASEDLEMCRLIPGIANGAIERWSAKNCSTLVVKKLKVYLWSVFSKTAGWFFVKGASGSVI